LRGFVASYLLSYGFENGRSRINWTIYMIKSLPYGHDDLDPKDLETFDQGPLDPFLL